MLHHCQFWKISLDFEDKLGSLETLIPWIRVAQISHSKLCVSVYLISVCTPCFSIHAWQGLLITPRIYFIEGRNPRKPWSCVEIAWNSAHLKSNVRDFFCGGGGGWNPARRIARIGHPSKFQPLSVGLTFKDRAEIGFSLWCKSNLFLIINFK